ncbi:MAG: fructose 1,6-bisphosphatase, partial [candidate division Zixibacteria bacterium SM23_81]
MKTTLSVIKADIGSIGGHIKPSQRLMEKVREYLEAKRGDIFTDYRVSSTGDDVAILFSHHRGALNEKIHK